jgi:DNA repair protein RecO (recombination protein O)
VSAPDRVDLEPAYVLHGRAYRETSQLIEVFTSAHGRVGIVARGSRRPKSPFRGLLDPFQPLRISWSGRGELATLRHAELSAADFPPTGQNVMAGFYANELLLKLLERRDPHPDLFIHYINLVSELRTGNELERSLRDFELNLLNEIGYGLNFSVDAITQEALVPDAKYEFRVDQGAIPAAGHSEGSVYTGSVLLAIGNRDFVGEETLRAAKTLLRAVLNFHIGDRGLQTRKVAAAMKRLS